MFWGMYFVLLGFAGFLTYTVMYIVNTIKKRPTQTAVIIMVVCFFLFAFGTFFSYNQMIQAITPQETTTTQGAAATQGEAVTYGKEGALRLAKVYLSIMAFSYTGLIEQLEYAGYTTEEATYAADYCGADWYKQAAKKAASYLEIMDFSRSALIEQLKFDGFTPAQAEYGVTQNGR